MEQEQKEQLERVLHAIRQKKWPTLEELWAEVIVEDPPYPLEFHKPVIQRLIHKQQLDHLTQTYETYISSLAEGEHAFLAMELISFMLSERAEADLEWCRKPLLVSLENVYAEIPQERLHALMDKAGLRDTNQSLNRSLRRFDDLLGARKGQVFNHSNWGVGVVTQLDLMDDKVTIDFARRKNQVMTLEGVRNFLQRLPNDHIRAHIALDPDGMREMLAKDPAEIIQISANSFGGKIKVSEMKKILTTDFLTESEYKSFWTAARKAIKLNPHIEQNGTGVNSELVILKEGKGFLDQVFASFATAKTTSDRREILRDVSRHGEDAGITTDDLKALYGLFIQPVASGAIKNDVDRLKHGILYLEYSDLFTDEMEGHKNPVDVRELLARKDVSDLIRGLESHEGRRIALELLLELHDTREVGEIYTDAILSMDSRTAAWMDKRLEKEKNDEAEHYRHMALERIFARPDENPELFVWASRNILSGNWKELASDLPPVMICEELLSLLSELNERIDSEEKPAADLARNQAARIRAVISDGNSKLFKKAIENSTFEEAHRLLRIIHLHDALSNQLKGSLEAMLLNVHGNLRKVSRMEEEEERRRPSHHYTTQESLDEKRSQLSRIRSEEIPELSKAIEVAREHGDLRENAEYHAAKDRQKLVMQQAAELEDLIARARVVEPRKAAGDISRFGTRLTLKEKLTGTISNVSLMGMWEANPDEGVISYLTPFGSQLLNRRKGESFTIKTQDGREIDYELLDIEVALRPGGVGTS